MIQRYLCACCVLAAGLVRAEEPQLRGFDDVRELIESSHIDSLDKLVKSLPLEFRSQYVLMTETQSAHHSTKLYPRVIMMGNECRLILAFSGVRDPDFDSLEMVEFNDDDATFVFHEIKFDRRRKADPVFSAANPRGCLDCHGQSPRPNWEPGIGWKGAIGEAKKLTREESNRLGVLMYRDVRYRGLRPLENRKRQYQDQETFSSKMADDLNRLNARRVARQLYDSPDYQTYKYALIAGLLDAPRFLNFVPMDDDAGRTKAKYVDLLNDVHCKVTESFASTKISGWNSNRGSGSFALADARLMTNLRYALETRGVDVSDYSTSFASPYFLTSAGKFSGKTIIKALYELDDELARIEPLPPNFENLTFYRNCSNAPTLTEYAAALEIHNLESFAAVGLDLPTEAVNVKAFKPAKCPQQVERERQEQAAGD